GSKQSTNNHQGERKPRDLHVQRPPQIKSNNSVSKRDGEKSSENNRVNDTVQRKTLKIAQTQKSIGANNTGAIKHLHQAVINSENEKNDWKDYFDQDHRPQPRIDSGFIVSQFHSSYFRVSRYSIISSTSSSVSSVEVIKSSYP